MLSAPRLSTAGGIPESRAGDNDSASPVRIGLQLRVTAVDSMAVRRVCVARDFGLLLVVLFLDGSVRIFRQSGDSLELDSEVVCGTVGVITDVLVDGGCDALVLLSSLDELFVLPLQPNITNGESAQPSLLTRLSESVICVTIHSAVEGGALVLIVGTAIGAVHRISFDATGRLLSSRVLLRLPQPVPVVSIERLYFKSVSTLVLLTFSDPMQLWVWRTDEDPLRVDASEEDSTSYEGEVSSFDVPNGSPHRSSALLLHRVDEHLVRLLVCTADGFLTGIVRTDALAAPHELGAAYVFDTCDHMSMSSLVADVAHPSVVHLLPMHALLAQSQGEAEGGSSLWTAPLSLSSLHFPPTTGTTPSAPPALVLKLVGGRSVVDRQTSSSEVWVLHGSNLTQLKYGASASREDLYAECLARGQKHSCERLLRLSQLYAYSQDTRNTAGVALAEALFQKEHFNAAGRVCASSGVAPDDLVRHLFPNNRITVASLGDSRIDALVGYVDALADCSSAQVTLAVNTLFPLLLEATVVVSSLSNVAVQMPTLLHDFATKYCSHISDESWELVSELENEMVSRALLSCGGLQSNHTAVFKIAIAGGLMDDALASLTRMSAEEAHLCVYRSLHPLLERCTNQTLALLEALSTEELDVSVIILAVFSTRNSLTTASRNAVQDFLWHIAMNRVDELWQAAELYEVVVAHLVEQGDSARLCKLLLALFECTTTCPALYGTRLRKYFENLGSQSSDLRSSLQAAECLIGLYNDKHAFVLTELLNHQHVEIACDVLKSVLRCKLLSDSVKLLCLKEFRSSLYANTGTIDLSSDELVDAEEALVNRCDPLVQGASAMRAFEDSLLTDVVLHIDVRDSLGPHKNVCLRAMESKVDMLREMTEAVNAANASCEKIKKDRTAFEHAVLSMNCSDSCMQCGLELSGDVVTFPCQHSSHRKCLLANLDILFFDETIAAIEKISEAMLELTVETRVQHIGKDKLHRALLQDKLDDLLAADCPFCGDFAIFLATKPLSEAFINCDHVSDWRLN